MSKNASGLKPLGRAVLLEHYEPERKDSVIQLPDSVEARSLMVEQRAVVVAIGEHAWPDEPARAVVGDKVYISKMAGFMTRGPRDGRVYRVVNDRDIFLQIVDEGEENV